MRLKTAQIDQELLGVVLDIDGTLADSNDAHASAFVEAFEKLGCTVDYNEVRPLIGVGADKLIPALNENCKIAIKVKEASEIKKFIFKTKYLKNIKPLPGAMELLKVFQWIGIKMVVGTSAGEEELDAILNQIGVGKLLTERVSSSGKESKPDPDIICEALSHFSCPKETIFMIGDTPYDIAAATEAGIRTIAFRCGGWSDDGLKGAVDIFDHPADLLVAMATIGNRA